MITSKIPFINWLPPLAWGVVILILSLMPGGPGNMNLFGIPHFDKIGHFGMYAVWTFLIYRAVSSHPTFTHHKSFWITLAFGTVIGIALEFGQLWMHQGRSFEPADMLANALGALAGVYTGKFFWKK